MRLTLPFIYVVVGIAASAVAQILLKSGSNYKSNLGAQGLYRKYGFKGIGIRKGY